MFKDDRQKLIYKISYIIIEQSHYFSNDFKILQKSSTCFYQFPLDNSSQNTIYHCSITNSFLPDCPLLSIWLIIKQLIEYEDTLDLGNWGLVCGCRGCEGGCSMKAPPQRSYSDHHTWSWRLSNIWHQPTILPKAFLYLFSKYFIFLITPQILRLNQYNNTVVKKKDVSYLLWFHLLRVSSWTVCLALESTSYVSGIRQ